MEGRKVMFTVQLAYKVCLTKGEAYFFSILLRLQLSNTAAVICVVNVKSKQNKEGAENLHSIDRLISER
jgi:hypothetical protein